MTILSKFLGGDSGTAKSPGVARRVHMRRLRGEIAATSGSERDALVAELALLEAEGDATMKTKLADHLEKRRDPAAPRMRKAAAAAKTTLATVRDRVARALGLGSAPTPAPVPAPAPTVPTKATDSVPWASVKVDANSTPEAVEAAMVSLLHAPAAGFKADLEARDPVALRGFAYQMDAVQAFLSAVAKVDPSGKIIERVDGGTPSERREAARVVGGILQRIKDEQERGTPRSASIDAMVRELSGAVSGMIGARAAAQAPASKPTGLDAVRAAIRREIN